MGVDYTVFHAADLAANLPFRARIWACDFVPAPWDMEAMILGLIEHHLHWLKWSRTKDAQEGKGHPEPVFPVKREPSADDRVMMPPEQMMEFVSGLINQEVGDGE